jgi:uncharacterized protein
VGLPDAGAVLAKIQASLELGDYAGIDTEERAAVAGYKRDDQRGRLRDWLEKVRSELVAAGTVIERPSPQSGEAGEDLGAWQRKIAELIGRLTQDVPVDRAQRSHEQYARWLLAYTLDWHRRENKAVWWDYYRLSELAADSGLTLVGIVGGTGKAPIHRYRFPPQESLQLFNGHQSPLTRFEVQTSATRKPRSAQSAPILAYQLEFDLLQHRLECSAW